MTTSSNDSLILKLSVAKNLIDQDLAKEVYQQCQRENRPAIELLISRGVLTPHIAENLVKEAERAQGPKTIGGFRIVSKLGQGGMGAVYKAMQLSMDREVALKVIAPEFAKDKAACDRFIREARAAGRINHPNVITCYDAGQDGNVLYMAMELVVGGDADQLAKAGGGRLSEKRAVEIVLASAKGLQAIHQAGLLHRDIKPANIFLSQDGVAKLADLGLARSQQGDDKMTVTGSTVGTPAFMSPEQADGADDIDIRSDIYALGATLYALTVGRAPFRGASPWAVVAAVLKDPFPHPRTANPDLSEALADLILKACARDRAERYQTPQELIAALEALAQTASDTVGTSPALPEIDHGTPRPRSSPTARPGKAAHGVRRPVAPRRAVETSASGWRFLWLLLLGGALLLGLAGWGIWGWQPTTTTPATPQDRVATASQVQIPVPQAQAPPPTAPIPQQVSAPVASSTPPSGLGVAPAATRIAQIFRPYQPATPPATAPLHLKSPTPAQAQALARFAGRWEPVKVIRDSAGMVASDKSNQCILIHPDHLMAHLYQYPQNDSWAVAESELEELGEAGFSIPLVRANGRAMNRLSFRLVEGLLEMTVWDDPKMFDDAKGTDPVTRGEPFRLKRIESCPAAADWEVSFWKQAHGTWFIPRSELHRWPNAPCFVSIDRKSRTYVNVWGNSTPLVFDPIRMVVKFSQYDRFRLTSDGLLYLHAMAAIPLQRLYQDPLAPRSGVNITHEDIWRLAEEESSRTSIPHHGNPQPVPAASTLATSTANWKADPSRPEMDVKLVMSVRTSTHILNEQADLNKAWNDGNTVRYSSHGNITVADRFASRPDVIVIHPPRPKEAATVDFSALTKARTGSLKLSMRRHINNGQCRPVVKLGGTAIDTVQGWDGWRDTTYRFDHQPFILELWPGAWWCEWLLFTYSITYDDVIPASGEGERTAAATERRADATDAAAAVASEKPADQPALPPAPGEVAVTQGMLMLYAKEKASLWINGKQVGSASAAGGVTSLPMDLRVGDLLVVSCSFSSGSGAVTLGWRGPDHQAFASRAERWVQLRGTEADIPGLSADMVAMVQNRPRKAGALSAETKELRDMLGGTPCEALDGGGKQSFLIATCLGKGDLVKIKEKP